MCKTAVDFLIKRIEDEAYVPRGRSFVDGRIVKKGSIGEALTS
jgi:hypothetical protein